MNAFVRALARLAARVPVVLVVVTVVTTAVLGALAGQQETDQSQEAFSSDNPELQALQFAEEAFPGSRDTVVQVLVRGDDVVSSAGLATVTAGARDGLTHGARAAARRPAGPDHPPSSSAAITSTLHQMVGVGLAAQQPAGTEVSSRTRPSTEATESPGGPPGGGAAAAPEPVPFAVEAARSLA